MYSRSYYDNIGEIEIPKGYDGTALSDVSLPEIESEMKIPEQIQRATTKISPEEPKEKEEPCCAASAGCSTEESGSIGGGILSYIKGLLPSGLFPFSLPQKIEIEDLILIGLALYLFFSKSGDKECAIMLAVLVFL